MNGKGSKLWGKENGREKKGQAGEEREVRQY